MAEPTILAVSAGEFADHLDGIANAMIASLNPHVPPITIAAVYAAAGAVRSHAARLRALGTAPAPDAAGSPIGFQPFVPRGRLLS